MEHLLARIGHVASGEDTVDTRRPHRIRLDDGPQTGRVIRRHDSNRRKRLCFDPEPWTHHHDIGIDHLPTFQFDTDDSPIVIFDDSPGPIGDHAHAGRDELRDIPMNGPDPRVQDDGEVSAQIAQKTRRMKVHGFRDDLDDAPVTDFIAVAERAVEDITTPMVRQSFDVGQLVDKTGRDEHTPRDQGVPSYELDPKPPALVSGNVDDPTVDDLAAVHADLGASDVDEFRRRQALAPQVAVHMCCRGVPRLAGIHDDHRTALPCKLEGRGESGGGTTDDRDVGETFDTFGVRMGMGLCMGMGVISHVDDGTLPSPTRKRVCEIRKEADMEQRPDAIERVVRSRLRSLRHSQDLSLNDLAAAANLSASTISRIETGKRTISLDVLVPLSRALQVDLDTLLTVQSDDDVVIRPVQSHAAGHTTWMLSRPNATTMALKIRLDPSEEVDEPRVHPGHDWFFVIEGAVALRLNDREIVVRSGEAAEFDTMTPHSITALDGPAEVIMIIDRDGQRAHVHHGPIESAEPGSEPRLPDDDHA